MIKLSNNIVACIATSVTNNSGVERSDKDLFLEAYKEYKGVSKKSRGQITKLLNEHTKVVTKSVNVQNTLKRVYKLAFNYLDMQIICKFDNLEYTNVSNLVKLFKYVDKHLEDKSKELREEVFSVYDSDMSPYRYNNAMSEKITALKEEYKLKEQEGEFVFIDMFNMVQQNITKMTNGQLLKLIELAERNITLDNEGGA